MSVHSIAALVAGALMLAPTVLHAEPLAPRDKPITVTVRTTTTVPLAAGSDEAALQLQARQSFYKAAVNECSVITATVKGDCALVQLMISTRRMDNRGTGGQPPTSNLVAEGTMSFAVTPPGALAQ